MRPETQSVESGPYSNVAEIFFLGLEHYFTELPYISCGTLAYLYGIEAKHT